MQDGTPYRVPRAAALWAAAFVALAVLVQATDFDRLNSFAERHLQPIAPGKGHPRLNDLAEAVVAPGAPVTAAALIAAAALLLWVNGRPREALAWPLALAAAIPVEIACKSLIGQHRSGVWHGFGLTFDSSFPSGHMLRAILVAGAITALWPPLRPVLGAWCAAVAVCMLITGFHLPTDIMGGVLAGLALATAADAARVRPSTSWPSAPSSRPADEAADRQSTSGSR